MDIFSKTNRKKDIIILNGVYYTNIIISWY